MYFEVSRSHVVRPGAPHQWLVGEGGTPESATFPAGRHHFESERAVGGSTAFAGDGEIAAGTTTELYLFGPAGAVQGRFVSYPSVVAAGDGARQPRQPGSHRPEPRGGGLHGDSQCTPLSPPLALGETFAGDFPLDATQDWQNGRFSVSNGARARIPPGPDRRGARPAGRCRCSYGATWRWVGAAACDPGGGARLHVAHRRHPGVLLDAPRTPRRHRNRRRSVVWVGGK